MQARMLICHTACHKWMLQQNQLCPTQPDVLTLYKLEIGRLGALGFNIMTENRTAEIHVEVNDQQKPIRPSRKQITVFKIQSEFLFSPGQ